MRADKLGMAFGAVLPPLLVALLLSSRPPGAAAYEAHSCNGTLGNFTDGSAFAANLDRLITSLPATASSSPSLFATTSLPVGASENASASSVHGMALCRGDLTDPSACLSCLRDAFRRLRLLCGGARDATLYADQCTARYSSDDFLSRPDDNAPLVNAMSATNASTYPGWDPRNATARSFFLSLVGTLFGEMTMYGAYNTSSSPRRFASAVMFINADLPTVYGLAQCTPDLAPAQCWHCFQGIGELNRQWYDGREGGRILGARCSFRYEGYQFFHGTPGVRIGTQHAEAAGSDGSSHKKTLIIAITVSITAASCVVLCFVVRLHRTNKHKAKKGAALHSRSSCSSKATEEALKLWRIEERGSEFTLFEFPELSSATGGFAEANRLGRGGFGPVYRGRLPGPGGAEVAVKRLAAQSGQGLEEFKNEIQLIAKLQHTNLVRLLGCCVQEEEKLLVYEYMPHRSLDGFIFDQRRGAALDWGKRMRIVEGVAQGMLYLHKHSRVRIIHRDLKASNILLDKDLNPKISDFGMARIFGNNMTEANTNRIVGTYGYMAPEYASEGIFSVKSDVYSFGVLLLEIVSGKRNSDHHQQHYGDFVNLLGYAWQLWKDGRAFELVDPTLGGEQGGGDVTTSVMRCIKVALLCVQDNATDRPTMADVTAMLAAGVDAASLPDPRRPPHFRLRVSSSDDGCWSEAGTRSSHGTTSCSANELTITTIQEGR